MKLHEWTNNTVSENLEKFPDYVLKCKLGEILKDRGMTMRELSELTGVRIGAISEMANLKRSTMNLPQLLVIIQTLRITDISELLEISIPEELKEQIEEDKKAIDFYGRLPEQEHYLRLVRESRKNPLTS